MSEERDHHQHDGERYVGNDFHNRHVRIDVGC